MMDFLLRDRDVSFAHGDLQLCHDDNNAIAQAIAIRLNTMSGEWFLDTQRGLPYLDAIFGHKRSERFIRQLIVPEVESVSGVKSVTKFSAVTASDRTMKIVFTAALTNNTVLTIDESIGI